MAIMAPGLLIFERSKEMTTTVQTNIIRDIMEQAGKIGERSDLYLDQGNGTSVLETRLNQVVQDHGDQAVDLLLDCLRDDEVFIRIMALVYLARIRDARAVEPIIRFMQEETRYVRLRPQNLPFRQRLF